MYSLHQAASPRAFRAYSSRRCAVLNRSRRGHSLTFLILHTWPRTHPPRCFGPFEGTSPALITRHTRHPNGGRAMVGRPFRTLRHSDTGGSRVTSANGAPRADAPSFTTHRQTRSACTNAPSFSSTFTAHSRTRTRPHLRRLWCGASSPSVAAWVRPSGFPGGDVR